MIIDAHLDLAMNAMEWNRDLRMPVPQIRDWENGLNDKPDRGRGTVSLPALREGNIGLVVATQIAQEIENDGVRRQPFDCVEQHVGAFRRQESADEAQSQPARTRSRGRVKRSQRNPLIAAEETILWNPKSLEVRGKCVRRCKKETDVSHRGLHVP